LLKYILCSKSRYKPKHTDCFNDLAFIKLFSEQLCLDTKKINEANSGPSAGSSFQDGLATPPTDFTELPMEASRDNATAQARAMPSANMTPTSTPQRSKKRKFYVVTRGRRTGVFDNW
jgi:hypothetical protein